MVTYEDRQVGWLMLRMQRSPQRPSSVNNLFLNCLTWEDEDKVFVHCLELDLIADGEDEEQATGRLAELIIEQLKMSEEDHVQLFHPAPPEYWKKLYEIHMNSVKQMFLDNPPKRKIDFQITRPQLTHA